MIDQAIQEKVDKWLNSAINDESKAEIKALSEAELQAAIADAIQETGASSQKDMGAVMNVLRPKVQGRADMGAVSSQVKAALSS